MRGGGYWALCFGLACFLACEPKRAPKVAELGGLETQDGRVRRLAPGCVAPAAEVCFNGVDDNCNGLVDEGCGVPGGVLQITAAWSDPDADVELVVIDPSQEPAEVGRILPSGLTKDRDCPGEGTRCKGVNVETVYLPSTASSSLESEARKQPQRSEGSPRQASAPSGTYRVRVVLERLSGASMPVTVRLSMRFGSRLESYEIRLGRVGESVVFKRQI